MYVDLLSNDMSPCWPVAITYENKVLVLCCGDFIQNIVETSKRILLYNSCESYALLKRGNLSLNINE